MHSHSLINRNELKKERQATHCDEKLGRDKRLCSNYSVVTVFSAPHALILHLVSNWLEVFIINVFFFPPPANKQLSFTALRYCLFLLSLREHIYLTFIFPGKVKQTCVFFFSAVLLHIHAVTATFTRGSATVRTRYPTVGHRAAPRDKWPQIKRVRSPQHISGAVKVEFRFNKHGSRPLPLFGVSLCYQILCY